MLATTPQTLSTPRKPQTRFRLRRKCRGARRPPDPRRESVGPACLAVASRPSSRLRLLLRRAAAGLTLVCVRVRLGFAVPCPLNPPRRPHIRFLFVGSLFVGSRLGLRLPSDSASRRTPLPRLAVPLTTPRGGLPPSQSQHAWHTRKNRRGWPPRFCFGPMPPLQSNRLRCFGPFLSRLSGNR